MGGSCPGLVFHGGIIQGKVLRAKVQGQLPWENFIGNCPGENYSGVIVHGAKILRLIFLREIS